MVTEQDRAKSALISLAADLVKGGGLPDPDLEEFRPMGKQAIRELIRVNKQRAQNLKWAADVLGR